MGPLFLFTQVCADPCSSFGGGGGGGGFLFLSITLTHQDKVNRMEVCQRKTLGINQIDRIPNFTITERAKVDDILKVISKTK